MSVTCFFCSENGSLSYIKSHIRRKHPLVNSKFYFGQNKCFRTFDKFKSAYKHIKKQHSELLLEDLTENSIDDFFIDHNLNESIVIYLVTVLMFT